MKDYDESNHQLDLAQVNLLDLIQRDVSLKQTARTNGGEWSGPCPFCGGEDRFNVWPQHPTGKGRYWCRQCEERGDAIDYLRKRDGLSFPEARAALGLTPPPANQTGSNNHNGHEPTPEIVHTYTYRDASGEPLYEVVRLEPKAYKPRQLNGKLGYGDVERVLYNLPRVLDELSDTVWLVEGEKTAEALADTGMTLTTIPGGAHGTWLPQYTQALTGKHVVILPDNDEPGRKYARRAAQELYGHAASVTVVELPGLEEGEDPEDWRKRGGTVKDLHLLARDTPPWRPPLNFPWLTPAQAKRLPPVEYLLPDLLPKNSLAMLYGQSGTMKTFMALDWAIRVAEQAPVLYVVTEGEGGVPRRLEAWERHHRKPVSEQMLQYHGAINLLDGPAVKAFIEDARVLRPALVVLDTLVNCAIGADENSTKDMSSVIAACKDIQRETGATVLLVHHSTKGGRWERGSSALRAAMDVMVEMSEANAVVTMRCTKSKDAKPFEKQAFRLVSVQGTESCVLLPAELVADEYDEELTPAEQEALEVLSAEIFVEAGITAARLLDITNMSETTAYRVLGKLKRLGYITQADRGEPYYISDAGLARLGLVT